MRVVIIVILSLFTIYLFNLKAAEPKPKPKPKQQIEAPKTPKKQKKKAQVKFVNYPAIRSVDNLGKVLSDIESHMPAGHIYKDSDKITWGHETTHGINSNLRMKYFSSEKRINGFYCLENKAVIIEEPGITISAVAKIVPQSLKGGVFNLYLVEQTASWNDTPLYLIDEWMGYSNGSAVRADLKIQDRQETVKYMFEFNIYCLSLMRAVKMYDKDYADEKQLATFIRWNIERSMSIFNNEEKAAAYLLLFKINPDAKDLRDFTIKYYGKVWSKKFLKI